MSLPWATVGPVPSGAAMRGAKRDAPVRRPPAAPRLSASAAPPPADARVAAWPRPRRFNLPALGERKLRRGARSEEHTSKLQSLMRISYAVFCLKKKKDQHQFQLSRKPQY